MLILVSGFNLWVVEECNPAGESDSALVGLPVVSARGLHSRPENLQVTEGLNLGELNIKFKRVTGARCYLVQYAEETTTGEVNWQSQACTTSRFTLKQLQTCKKYQVRIAVVGTNEQLLYSDPVWEIVQYQY